MLRWTEVHHGTETDQIRLDHQDCLVSFCPARINKLRTELSLKRQESEKLHKKTWRVGSFIVAHDKRKKNQSKVLDDDLSLHHADCI